MLAMVTRGAFYLWLRAAPFFWCVLAGGCSEPRGDCLTSGECECTGKEQCANGLDCINGKCDRLTGPPPPQRGFGEACQRHPECISGWCLPEGPGNGGVCTQGCDAGACPEGWDCKTHLVQDGDGPVQLCVQHIPDKLCRPCSAAHHCNAIGDLCLGLSGEFACAKDCSLDGKCPGGFQCNQLTVPGGLAWQCQPIGGSCECSEATLGLTQSCTYSNQHGTCYGVETCEPGQPLPEWGSCDAPEPGREICNGIDDDCDGLTDAEDPSVDISPLPPDPPYPGCRKGSVAGECVGRWACQMQAGVYLWVCGALDPENEVCNGRDDNCDGVPDDPFIDAIGRYVHREHCGSCGKDCNQIVPHLRRDPVGNVAAGAVFCQIRRGAPLCVPSLCEPGYYPYPEYQPVTCAELVSSSCQPCTDNSDCRISSDRCVNLGDDPKTFCVQSCDPGSPYFGCTGEVGVQSCCPEKYLCRLSQGGRFCLPSAGTCTCNAERLGVVRSCLINGAAGEMCQGIETCEQDGSGSYLWSECRQSTVVVEVCDGRDNNCDGRVDEGFINLEGEYDADQHCGECNHNCLTMWNRDIQHAVGGCVKEPAGHRCRILACTSELLPTLGLCRRDEECPAGSSCSQLYHHCIPTGSDCPGGACGTPCVSSEMCREAYGPESTCVENVCQVEFLFNDTNHEETDGCECPAAVGAGPDEPDRSGDYPESGATYVDRNCDGVDGVAGSALFVWAGTDQSLGSRQHPYASIAEALAAYDPSVHSGILVATGYYLENLTLSEGTRLYGGYSPDFGGRDIVLFPSIIRGSEPDPGRPGFRPGTVYAEGIRSKLTVLSGFTIYGYDVNADPRPSETAQSSSTVHVRDCNSNLVVMNNAIVAGRGGDGGSGLPGAPGQNGGNAENGRNSWECPGSRDCAGLQQPGGAGGTNPGCFSATGNPGATARGYAYDPQDYRAGGVNGRGGNNSIYAHSDPEQFDLCKYDCQVPTGGTSCNGEDALLGVDGNAGALGSGCTETGGTTLNGFWMARAGTGGSSGSHGNGGGGGGAGGAVINNNPVSCTKGNPYGDLGASGGGGGAGGCGAVGGQGGGGGGGSFGVFLYFSTLPDSVPLIAGNRIRRGFGGRGGAGGGGGQGGLGGQGGEGGQTVLPAWCAGSAGRGGRGGDGGAGGGGGGACGGISYGIATNYLDGNPSSILNNAFETPGVAATGGAGGAGGPSPAGSSYAGSRGADGEFGDWLVY